MEMLDLCGDQLSALRVDLSYAFSNNILDLLFDLHLNQKLIINNMIYMSSFSYTNCSMLSLISYKFLLIFYNSQFTIISSFYYTMECIFRNSY